MPLKEITREVKEREGTRRERYFICKHCYDEKTGTKPQEKKPPILSNPDKVVGELL